MLAARPTIFCDWLMPNSLATRTALCRSPPALAMPITSAPELCACSMKEAKSEAPMGWCREPSTSPPAFSTALVASYSMDLPSA